MNKNIQIAFSLGLVVIIFFGLGLLHQKKAADQPQSNASKNHTATTKGQNEQPSSAPKTDSGSQPMANDKGDDFPHEFFIDSPDDLGPSAEAVACELYKQQPGAEIDLCSSRPAEIVEIHERHPKHKDQIRYIVSLRNDQNELMALVQFLSDLENQGGKIKLITNTVEPHPAAYVDATTKENMQKGDVFQPQDKYPLIDENQAELIVRKHLGDQAGNASIQRICYVDLYLFAHSIGDYALVNKTFFPLHEFQVDGHPIWVDSEKGRIFTEADAAKYEQESPDDYKTFDPEHGDFIDEQE